MRERKEKRRQTSNRIGKILSFIVCPCDPSDLFLNIGADLDSGSSVRPYVPRRAADRLSLMI